MRLITSTVVSPELLDQARKILDGIARGTTGKIELDGEDEGLIRQAIASHDDAARVYHAKSDGDGVLRIRVYTTEELTAKAERPSAKRKPRAKTKS